MSTSVSGEAEDSEQYRKRNKNIFHQSTATHVDYNISLDELLKKTGRSASAGPAMDKETENTIKECLKGFFFTDDAGLPYFYFLIFFQFMVKISIVYTIQ
jgi:hypothetical protein